MSPPAPNAAPNTARRVSTPMMLGIGGALLFGGVLLGAGAVVALNATREAPPSKPIATMPDKNDAKSDTKADDSQATSDGAPLSEEEQQQKNEAESDRAVGTNPDTDENEQLPDGEGTDSDGGNRKSPDVDAMQHSITPGQSIGEVRLDDTRESAIATLGKPKRTRRDGDLTRDTWLGSKRRDDSGSNFLEVTTRGNKVVQIEATSPVFVSRGDLSTNSSVADLFDTYKSLRGYDFLAENAHTYYLDAENDGVTFRFEGYQDSLTPDSKPSSILVHAPGEMFLSAKDEAITNSPLLLDGADKSLVDALNTQIEH